MINVFLRFNKYKVSQKTLVGLFWETYFGVIVKISKAFSNV